MKNFIATIVFKLGTRIMLIGVDLHKRFKTPAGVQLINIENFQSAFLSALQKETEAKKNRSTFYVVKGSEELH